MSVLWTEGNGSFAFFNVAEYRRLFEHEFHWHIYYYFLSEENLEQLWPYANSSISKHFHMSSYFKLKKNTGKIKQAKSLP